MNATAVYQETTVTTQSPGKLIVMLYDGAIGFLKRAQRSMEDHDIAEKNHSINCARDIIMELNSSLDLERGGQTAHNLRSLYNFLWCYLSDVNSKNDTQMLAKAINLLDQLGQAWRKITS
jgi:flagellar protein FliS